MQAAAICCATSDVVNDAHPLLFGWRQPGKHICVLVGRNAECCCKVVPLVHGRGAVRRCQRVVCLCQKVVCQARVPDVVHNRSQQQPENLQLGHNSHP